jgi:hypothetical protein
MLVKSRHDEADLERNLVVRHLGGNSSYFSTYERE